MTPREPDRFEAKAKEIADRHIVKDYTYVGVQKQIAAALRAEYKDGAREARSDAYDVIRHHIKSPLADVMVRALASPAAAAPAAETGKIARYVVPAPRLAAAEARIAELERRVEAGLRLAKYRYCHWQMAGGDPECAHGFNLGIACARCDLITLETGAARTSPGAAGEGT